MPQARLTVDAVLTLASAVARKHASQASTAADTPELRQAVAQVWELVRGRLPEAQTRELDAAIKKITAARRACRMPEAAFDHSPTAHPKSSRVYS